VVGIVLALVGAVAGIIAFTATKWYSDLGRAHFSDVHKITKIAEAHTPGIAKAYFSWLAWVVLIVAVLVAIAANLPSGASPGLRAVGAIVALAGIGLTFWALKLSSGGYGQYVKHAAKAPSLYLVVGGFLLILIGSLMGPRRA